MATTTHSNATESDLLRMPKDGRKYELVDGEIRVSPAGTRHGKACVNLLVRRFGPDDFVDLGDVIPAFGFKLRDILD